MTTALAVALAAVGAFLVSGAWYGALGSRLARLSPAWAEPARPGPTVAVELARGLVVAAAVAWLAARADVSGVGGALALAGVLWVAFPVVLLAGSVFHERVPAAVAAVHAGDWLLKLAVVCLVVALVP